MVGHVDAAPEVVQDGESDEEDDKGWQEKLAQHPAEYLSRHEPCRITGESSASWGDSS